jgi:hypothetical protein
MKTSKFWTPFWAAHYIVMWSTLYVRVKLYEALHKFAKKVGP